jgi:hypothetical protein
MISFKVVVWKGSSISALIAGFTVDVSNVGDLHGGSK